MIGLGLHLQNEFWSQSATVPNNIWFTIVFSSLTLVYAVLVTPFICLLTLPHSCIYVVLDIRLATGVFLVAIQTGSNSQISSARQIRIKALQFAVVLGTMMVSWATANTGSKAQLCLNEALHGRRCVLPRIIGRIFSSAALALSSLDPLILSYQ